MGIEQKIADKLISHTISTIRFSETVSAEAIKNLKILEKDIADKMLLPNTPFRERRLLANLNTIKLTIANYYNKISSDLSATLYDVASLNELFLVNTFNANLSPDFLSTSFTPLQLSMLVTGPVHGAASDVWLKKQSKAFQKQLLSVVKTGFLSGHTNSEMEKSMTDIFAGNRRNLQAVIRTSILSIANSTQDKFIQDNSDITNGYVWLSTLDNRTTSICMARSNLTWDLNYQPIDHNLSWGGGPGIIHWNCRSIRVPLIKASSNSIFDSLPPATRSSMDGPVPASETFDSFLNRHKDTTITVMKRNPGDKRRHSVKVNFLDNMLGVGKADLFRKGKITVANLVNFEGNPLTLTQILNSI